MDQKFHDCVSSCGLYASASVSAFPAAGGAGIFHESLAAEFGQLADKYELYEINQILNMQDYPDDVLGRAAGLVVGGHWAMTLASTQQEGKYASAITEIPVAAREAKRTLLEELT